METLLGVCPILLLHGQAGVGKSTVATQLMWWWHATGLVERAVLVDVRDIPQDSLTGDSIIKDIETSLGNSSEPFVLVLDSIELLSGRFTEADDSSVKVYLESLVVANKDAYTPGNNYIVLVSRPHNALSWDLAS